MDVPKQRVFCVCLWICELQGCLVCVCRLVTWADANALFVLAGGVWLDRFALADAGDSLEDANFAVDSANKAILALTGEEVGALVYVCACRWLTCPMSISRFLEPLCRSQDTRRCWWLR